MVARICVRKCSDCVSVHACGRGESERYFICAGILVVRGSIVLYDLQRVLGMAKGQETEFVSMLQEKNKKMTKSDLSEKAKELLGDKQLSVCGMCRGCKKRRTGHCVSSGLADSRHSCPVFRQSAAGRFF